MAPCLNPPRPSYSAQWSWPTAELPTMNFLHASVKSRNAYVIDRDGTILYVSPLSRETERRFRAILTVLGGREAGNQ